MDWSITVSERPIDDAHIYHYHRPQMERELRANSIVTVHHDLDDPDPFVIFSKFEEHYKAAKKVICLNSRQREWLAARGIHNTIVIPHGFDGTLFSKLEREVANGRKAVLGIVSKRYPRRFKGEVMLYALLQRLDPSRIKLLLVGQGRWEDALFAQSMGFEVECHEVMPYRLFPEVYRTMDFLVMVSTFEGGPANIPEAVATGTPMFCTNVGMVKDMVSDGVNGITLDANPATAANQIMRVLNNIDGQWDALVKGARETNSAPTWDEVIERHRKLYLEISGYEEAPALATENVANTKDDGLLSAFAETERVA